MRKVGIVTIVDNDNYGNRLQNYALQEVIKKLGFDVTTLKNDSSMNKNSKIALRKINFIRLSIIRYLKSCKKRRKCFTNFNKNIEFSKHYINPRSNISGKYEYFICGSDQIWKPTYGRMREVDLLSFANDNQKVSYAASFGVNSIDRKYYDFLNKHLRSFKAISVREDAGKKIVKEVTKREDAQVVLDPTFLIDAADWKKVEKKPENFEVPKNYILCYFLGKISDERSKIINDYAQKNKLEIINILDKNSIYYESGPAEFLYLESHADIILTDSFHSCVFSIINQKPFVIYDREDNKVNMNSRIETLCNTFKLNNKYTGKIENIKIDYKKINSVLKKKRNESIQYLIENLKSKK